MFAALLAFLARILAAAAFLRLAFGALALDFPLLTSFPAIGAR